MSDLELSREAEWHASRSAKLFEKVRQIRDQALSAEPMKGADLLRKAMAVEFEADEHLHHSNVLDSVRAARLPFAGTGLVVTRANAYTVRQRM